MSSSIDHSFDLIVVKRTPCPCREPDHCEGSRDTTEGQALSGQIVGEADDLVFLLVDVDPAIYNPEAEGRLPADEPADALHVPDRHGGPLSHNVALELGEHRQQPEQHLPGSAGGLDPLRQAYKIGVPAIEAIGDGKGVPGRSRQPGEAVDHQGIASPNRLKSLLKRRTVVGTATT